MINDDGRFARDLWWLIVVDYFVKIDQNVKTNRVHDFQIAINAHSSTM